MKPKPLERVAQNILDEMKRNAGFLPIPTMIRHLEEALGDPLPRLVLALQEMVDTHTARISDTPRMSKARYEARHLIKKYHTQVPHGLCDICFHHGSDCTGVKP